MWKYRREKIGQVSGAKARQESHGCGGLLVRLIPFASLSYLDDPQSYNTKMQIDGFAFL
jgi:hypothetical protein